MNQTKLRIIPIGGMGNVTKNMFVYEYEDEMLLVDCGIGFPEQYMLGVDVLIPDVTYIQKRLQEGAKIVGLCLTHGHDDHIAALPYVLPELAEIQKNFPMYGSRLTIAFAKERLADANQDWPMQEYPERAEIKLGKYFTVAAIRVTHSIPDARHLAINTPEGLCYHGSDFKFDMNPIDGMLSDFHGMAAVGEHGVLCAMVDCLRIERATWSPSENTIREALEKKIRDCKGKFIVTLMSSNLHRVQQTIDVAVEHGRKVVFIGRSIEQNAEIAQELKMLNVPRGTVVQKRQMGEYKDNQLCLIIAGSQGQPGSSLVRAVFGEHPLVEINKQDRVVFSTEPIPGNEQNVYGTIDELSRNNIDVVYSDIEDHLHVSGHAGKTEQQLLVALLKPKYLMPIGGADRHRVQFAAVVQDMGYRQEQILIPEHGRVVEFSDSRASKGEVLFLKDLMVDGLGVGDVGTVVLADRKTMAEEGMVVVILPRQGDRFDLSRTRVVSRGFVFMKKADELVTAIEEEVANTVKGFRGDDNELKKQIEKRLTKLFEKNIGRTPLVLPVFFEE